MFINEYQFCLSRYIKRLKSKTKIFWLSMKIICETQRIIFIYRKIIVHIFHVTSNLMFSEIKNYIKYKNDQINMKIASCPESRIVSQFIVIVISITIRYFQ